MRKAGFIISSIIAFYSEYSFFFDGCAIGIVGLIIRKIYLTVTSIYKTGARESEFAEPVHTQLKNELVDNTLLHPIETFYTLEGNDSRHINRAILTDANIKLILTFMENGKKLYFNPIDRISIGGKEDECDITFDGLSEEAIAEIYFNTGDNMFYIRRISSVQTVILLNAKPLLSELKIKNGSVIRFGGHDIHAATRITD